MYKGVPVEFVDRWKQRNVLATGGIQPDIEFSQTELADFFSIYDRTIAEISPRSNDDKDYKKEPPDAICRQFPAIIVRRSDPVVIYVNNAQNF